MRTSTTKEDEKKQKEARKARVPQVGRLLRATAKATGVKQPLTAIKGRAGQGARGGGGRGAGGGGCCWWLVGGKMADGRWQIWWLCGNAV